MANKAGIVFGVALAGLGAFLLLRRAKAEPEPPPEDGLPPPGQPEFQYVSDIRLTGPTVGRPAGYPDLPPEPFWWYIWKVSVKNVGDGPGTLTITSWTRWFVGRWTGWGKAREDRFYKLRSSVIEPGQSVTFEGVVQAQSFPSQYKVTSEAGELISQEVPGI